MNSDMPEMSLKERLKKDWKGTLYTIIFQANTPAGKRFDLWLLVVILLSIVVILFDSVLHIHQKYGIFLVIAEWFFTILFTIEFTLRVLVSKNKFKYIFSFFGFIDLISILPAFLSIFNPDFQFLMVLRSLRLLRIFKILHMRSFLVAISYISKALSNSYRKILVFMMFIALLVIIIGSIMYVVEDGSPGFESIPDAIYWAVVTVTTVGYGDVSPNTPLGKFLSIIVMLCGYGIIAVPTGIVTSEFARSQNVLNRRVSTVSCERCGQTQHLPDARYCKTCGERLPVSKVPKKSMDDETIDDDPNSLFI